MKKSVIAKLISILLIAMLVVGSGCLFFLPKLYNYFKDPSVVLFQNQTLFYKVAFFTCYIICLVIVFLLIRLFQRIYKGTPFKVEIEQLLKMMAVLFMILFVIVLIKTLFIPTLLSMVVFLLCFLISLSFYVLAEVIKAAIYYKEEVDGMV